MKLWTSLKREKIYEYMNLQADLLQWFDNHLYLFRFGKVVRSLNKVSLEWPKQKCDKSYDDGCTITACRNCAVGIQYPRLLRRYGEITIVSHY
jgi:hypothetical protein